MNKILFNTNGEDLHSRSIVKIHRNADGEFSISSNDSDVAIILTWV